MTLTVRLLLITLLLTLGLGLLVLSSLERGYAQPNGWRALLAEVTTRDGVVLLGFSAPLAATGERSRLIEDAAQLELGDDYLCFSEAWNNGQRKTCTPLSNLSSLTFTSP